MLTCKLPQQGRTWIRITARSCDSGSGSGFSPCWRRVWPHRLRGETRANTLVTTTQRHSDKATQNHTYTQRKRDSGLGRYASHLHARHGG